MPEWNSLKNKSKFAKIGPCSGVERLSVSWKSLQFDDFNNIGIIDM